METVVEETLHVQTEAVEAPRVENATEWASRFTSKFFQPGLISYEDVGDGVAYVSKQVIDRDVNSFVGRPVVIMHRPNDLTTNEKIQRVLPKNMERAAVGYISKVYYNEADGWYYAEGTIHNDEGKKAIRNGWKVSCGYALNQSGPGGTKNGIRFDKEFLSFTGEHLAIVPKGRYEEADITIHNAKEMSLFTIFKNKPAKKSDDPSKPVENATVETEQLPADTEIEIQPGIRATIAALANWVRGGRIIENTIATSTAVAVLTATQKKEQDAAEIANAELADATKPKVTQVANAQEGKTAADKKDDETLSTHPRDIGPDDEVTVDGTRFKWNAVEEIVRAHQKTVQNAKDQAAAHDAAVAKAADEAAAAANFSAIENARDSAPVVQFATEPEDHNTRLKRGQERYGSPKSSVSDGKN